MGEHAKIKCSVSLARRVMEVSVKEVNKLNSDR